MFVILGGCRKFCCITIPSLFSTSRCLQQVDLGAKSAFAIYMTIVCREKEPKRCCILIKRLDLKGFKIRLVKIDTKFKFLYQIL